MRLVWWVLLYVDAVFSSFLDRLFPLVNEWSGAGVADVTDKLCIYLYTENGDLLCWWLLANA